MSHEITDHHVDGKVHVNHIRAIDEKGQGGARHHYRIENYNHMLNPANEACPTLSQGYSALGKTSYVDIVFQNGPINEENAPNGIHVEDLLAICIDRLRDFDNGEFATPENKTALSHLEGAMGELKLRTRKRIERGVEGTHEK